MGLKTKDQLLDEYISKLRIIDSLQKDPKLREIARDTIGFASYMLSYSAEQLSHATGLLFINLKNKI